MTVASNSANLASVGEGDLHVNKYVRLSVRACSGWVAERRKLQAVNSGVADSYISEAGLVAAVLLLKACKIHGFVGAKRSGKLAHPRRQHQPTASDHRQRFRPEATSVVAQRNPPFVCRPPLPGALRGPYCEACTGAHVGARLPEEAMSGRPSWNPCICTHTHSCSAHLELGARLNTH